MVERTLRGGKRNRTTKEQKNNISLEKLHNI
jgi:hypothetical protein